MNIMKKDNYSTQFLKQRLKDLRKINNLTQGDVANMIGLPRSTYSGYEKGTREAGYEVLIKLANLFDVSIDYLLGITEKKTTYQIEKNVYKVLYSNDLHWNGIPIDEKDIQPIRTLLENIMNARALKDQM